VHISFKAFGSGRETLNAAVQAPARANALPPISTRCLFTLLMVITAPEVAVKLA
jgi:hypothetical protein